MYKKPVYISPDIIEEEEEERSFFWLLEKEELKNVQY